jgi:hypothetical protein
VTDNRPEQAYILHPTMTGTVVLVVKGRSGFWPIKRLDCVEEAGQLARTLNRSNNLHLSAAMAEAMLVGSMFGWDVPGAFPAAYDPDGKMKGAGVMHPEAESGK